jgi:DMSO/TMAO reductase YedYZ heme-binding membrane subunit
VTTWIILRAAGVGAYLTLFLSVAFGLVATSAPFDKRFAKQSAISIHQFLSTVGLVLLGVHIAGLLLDSYVHFGPKEILVPGASTYRPVAVAFGVIAMYAMVVVLVSSWMRRHYSAKLWRRLHLFAVPAFVLSMVHGVFAGADASRRWMYLIYVITVCIVVFLLILRGLTVGLRPARRAQSSPGSPPPPDPELPPWSSSDDGAAVGTEPVERSAGDRVAVGSADRVSVGRSASREEEVSATKGGAETWIGVAGSVRRVPATTKAPAMRAAASATPAAPHPTTIRPRRNTTSP